MAVTVYSTADALTVKQWRRKLFREIIRPTDVGRFFGMDSNSLIQIVDDTKKDQGDRVTIGLRLQLTGAGVSGDGTLEGAEEALVTNSDNVFIEQLRHAVRSAGHMTEQRVMYDVREEARMGLTDWWRDRLSVSFFNQICGNLAQTDVRFTGMQTAVTADAAHNLVARSTVEGEADPIFTSGANVVAGISASNGNRMNLSFIDVAVSQAKTTIPFVRPIMIPNMGESYVMFIHPFQTRDMRRATGTGSWQDIQKAALMGGQITNSPLFTGALGMYNNVILHEDSRVSLGADNSGTAVANTRAAVLCGAQASSFAMGKGYDTPDKAMQVKMSWEEELFDYGNQYGVAAGMIWGLKKMQFNSVDFSTIRIVTRAVGN